MEYEIRQFLTKYLTCQKIKPFLDCNAAPLEPDVIKVGDKISVQKAKVDRRDGGVCAIPLKKFKLPLSFLLFIGVTRQNPDVFPYLVIQVQIREYIPEANIVPRCLYHHCSLHR